VRQQRPLPTPNTSADVTFPFQGFLQTVPWFAVLAVSASLSILFASTSDSFSPAAAVLGCLYCTQANFLINAMHELGHGHVFKTKFLNHLFMRIFSFLGWLHPDMFFSSHLRHHRFTQNPPFDLENPAPIRITFRDFLSFGFVNVKVL
jgi:fatty acid desaturase